jgi:hypothetical protein
VLYKIETVARYMWPITVVTVRCIPLADHRNGGDVGYWTVLNVEQQVSISEFLQMTCK